MHPRTPACVAVGTAMLAAVVVIPSLTDPPEAPPTAAPPLDASPVEPAPTGFPPISLPPDAGGAAGPPAGREQPAKRAVSPGPGSPTEPAEPADSADSADSVKEGPVSAAALLAKAGRCDQISKGNYRADDDSPASIPICDAKGAVFWKADLDIDCDGQVTARCNSRSDPYFQDTTAYTRSDGSPLNAEELPYIVVPTPSQIWNYRSSGIRGGSVAAVIHGDKVRYAVVGDTGPPGIIGEASYAAARGLGILTDPAGGGASSGVTYVLFKNSKVSPLEDQHATARLGAELAKKFLKEN
ncbi:glycoside hydrolase family 75 protein [Streptomyces sp. NPDC088400]|uniref:glycoside hydrolase family 75 protein n=1 Tax=Streptomyces sp. NPDC088400 TaxID=3365861 RepID=UPI0037FC5E2C